MDAVSGLVHTVNATVAHMADIPQTHHLRHGEEQVAFADAGYQGVAKLRTGNGGCLHPHQPDLCSTGVPSSDHLRLPGTI